MSLRGRIDRLERAHDGPCPLCGDHAVAALVPQSISAADYLAERFPDVTLPEIEPCEYCGFTREAVVLWEIVVRTPEEVRAVDAKIKAEEGEVIGG